MGSRKGWIERTKALRDGLDGAERALAGANGDEGNGGVDTAEGRDIDGLATDGTGGTNTGGVLTGTAVDDGINSDLDGVGVGGDVDLNGKVRLRSTRMQVLRVSKRRMNSCPAIRL
jgi:hypothetical protein